MPGSQPSSEPCRTSSRLPRSGSSASRSGIHGASPSTRSTDGSSAAAIATAPPIEKPSKAVCAPSASRIAARASSMQLSSRRHDLTRYRTSTKRSSGRRGARRRTSHSSDALHVPSTSPFCPPSTHTTTSRPRPVTRISAPVERSVGRARPALPGSATPPIVRVRVRSGVSPERPRRPRCPPPAVAALRRRAGSSGPDRARRGRPRRRSAPARPRPSPLPSRGRPAGARPGTASRRVQHPLPSAARALPPTRRR